MRFLRKPRGASASSGEITPPLGALIDYAGASDPESAAGWAIADGRPMDAVTDPTLLPLYNVIGTKYGGTGQSNFLLPDTRGRVTVAVGTHAEVNDRGKSEGLAVGSRKLKHQHGRGTLATGTEGAHAHSAGDIGGAWAIAATGGGGPALPPLAGAATLTFQNATGLLGGNTGQGGAHAHTFSGAIGDTAGPVDGPAFLVTQKIIRIR